MFTFAEVGGAVRDGLLGLDSKDVDFVAVPTSLAAFSTADEAFAALVADLKCQGFQVFLETPQFFTVRAQVPDGHPLKTRTNVADFVLARRDGPSSDGRRPDFVLPGTLHDDLERRDFTINAMAILPNGELVDPFGGSDDLDAELIRFVGDPMERIKEDGLRVVRALRFCVTKGFDIEANTWEALTSELAMDMVRKVSIERIREELDKMFSFSSTDTLIALHLINNLPVCTQRAIFRDGLRLQPTLKK